jgi:hypothetical protein
MHIISRKDEKRKKEKKGLFVPALHFVNNLFIG